MTSAGINSVSISSVRSMYSVQCKCECKYNVSTVSSVSVRPVNKITSI